MESPCANASAPDVNLKSAILPELHGRYRARPSACYCNLRDLCGRISKQLAATILQRTLGRSISALHIDAQPSVAYHTTHLLLHLRPQAPRNIPQIN